MHPTHNTLSENIRAQSVELLNKHLAASIDLQAQVKQAHWNVRGPSFIAVHKLFDDVAAEVGAYSDQLAERATGLGGTDGRDGPRYTGSRPRGGVRTKVGSP